jgi:hypothetical protein
MEHPRFITYSEIILDKVFHQYDLVKTPHVLTFHAWTPDLWSSHQRECTLDEIISLSHHSSLHAPFFFQPSYIQRRS